MTAGGMDTWAAGRLYEPYVGRWSRLVAEEFVAWLQPSSNWEWLDVGCGTGALTEVLLRGAYPCYVTGVDSSAGFIDHARSRITDPRATFRIADAQSLPADFSHFDAAVSGLLLNFVPQPIIALHEMVRAVRPGGLVAAYVWDYADKMKMMRCFWDAAVALDPAAAELDEARRFPLCAPGPLRELFAEGGLAEVQVRAIDVCTQFRNFNEYWNPFLGGQGPAPAYAISLSERNRNALRDKIHASLPIAANGSIKLLARAWAIRGITAR
jgi:SAM-dependent methyltransferase